MLKVISVSEPCVADSTEPCVSQVGMSPGSVAVADAGGGGGGGAIPHIGMSPAIAGKDSMRIKATTAQSVRKVFIVFS